MSRVWLISTERQIGTYWSTECPLPSCINELREKNEWRYFSGPGFDNMRQHGTPAEGYRIEPFICSIRYRFTSVFVDPNNAYRSFLYIGFNFDIVGNY